VKRYNFGALLAHKKIQFEPVRFEFDPAKSALTKADPNRSISFEEAQAIWIDLNHIELPLPFISEPRTAVIGKIGPDLWTAIVTQRGENIRIISVRRAHPKEEKIYAQD
jgi:uncharacterized protein